MRTSLVLRVYNICEYYLGVPVTQIALSLQRHNMGEILQPGQESAKYEYWQLTGPSHNELGLNQS